MKISDYAITSLSYIKQTKKRSLIGLAYELRSKKGIEIGGPSSIFGLRGYFPVYIFASQIDGVNFSTETVWEGKISEGPSYKYYKNRRGYQFISEASDLSFIDSDKYDFVLSSHNLEHMANPLKTLKEWQRVIKPAGIIALVLPDKENTFDHRRLYTTFDHLLKDYENNEDEYDDTHFNEVVSLHDISIDKGINSITELRNRIKNNFINRCVHHHVFSFEVIKQMLDFTGFATIYQQKAEPFHLITVAKKI
jgi:SAM-dependent methyltransferase